MRVNRKTLMRTIKELEKALEEAKAHYGGTLRGKLTMRTSMGIVLLATLQAALDGGVHASATTSQVEMASGVIRDIRREMKRGAK